MNHQQTEQPTALKVFVSPLSHSVTYRLLKNYISNRIGADYKLQKSKNKGKNKYCHAIIEVFNRKHYNDLLHQPFIINDKVAQVKEWLDPK
jgi:hypothetical protein